MSWKRHLILNEPTTNNSPLMKSFFPQVRGRMQTIFGRYGFLKYDNLSTSLSSVLLVLSFQVFLSQNLLEYAFCARAAPSTPQNY